MSCPPGLSRRAQKREKRGFHIRQITGIAFWAYAGARMNRRKKPYPCFEIGKLLLFASPGEQDDEEPGDTQGGQRKIGGDHAPSGQEQARQHGAKGHADAIDGLEEAHGRRFLFRGDAPHGRGHEQGE